MPQKKGTIRPKLPRTWPRTTTVRRALRPEEYEASYREQGREMPREEKGRAWDEYSRAMSSGYRGELPDTYYNREDKPRRKSRSGRGRKR